MKKINLFLIVMLLFNAFSPSVNARNTDVPEYDGTRKTRLEPDQMRKIQLDGDYVIRASKHMVNADTAYLGPYRYPTFFQGKVGKSTILSAQALSEPYIQISNFSYVVGGAGPYHDRMLSEVERFNPSNISSRYNGNGEYVFETLNKGNKGRIRLSNVASGADYGEFYWIRDIAYLSGGYASAGGIKDINRYDIYVVVTSKPEITNFTAKGSSLTQPVIFKLNGYEYVSKGRFASGSSSTTYNPWGTGDDRDRNLARWELKITKDGKEVYSNKRNIRSQLKINPSKPNEIDAGYVNEDISFQPQSCGKYEAEIKLIDHVERSTAAKTVNFTIDQNCDSTPPPEPPPTDGDCNYSIGNPSAVSTVNQNSMNSNANGVIRADARGAEQFDVLKGIPTSEALFANAFAREYLVKHQFANMSGEVTYNVPVKKTYELKWTEKKKECSKGPDGKETCKEIDVPKSEMKIIDKTYKVLRPYSYWLINNLEVNGLNSAIMNNYALPNGSVTLNPNGYSAPSVEADNNDNVTSHVRAASCSPLDLGTQTVDGGSKKPSVPDENFQSKADAAVGQNNVRNDKVIFNGSTIMNDSWTTINAPAPSIIPEATMTGQNVFYRAGMIINNRLLNKENTLSSGVVNYDLIKGIKGGSPVTQQINGINTVTVHTPVVIYANTSDDKEHDQRTKPSTTENSVILDRPFTIYMPTNGQHRDIKGYGNRDYTKYMKLRQVSFPFGVYQYENGSKGSYVPANTWIDVKNEEKSKTFFMPVWIDEGTYDISFRVFAENSPNSGFTIEHQANLQIPNHVAVDTVKVDVIGRMYDFKITDVSDYAWESVFRERPKSPIHTGNYYWVGDKNIDGLPRGNNHPFALPIMPGKHPIYENISVKKGYHFKFDLKTKGNMFSENDGIRIKPTFYFVDKEGKNRQEIDLYYSTKQKPFIKIGSEEDKERRYVILDSRLRNVPQNNIIEAADYAFNNYSNVTTTNKTQYIAQYLEDARDKTLVGNFDWMILPYRLKTHIGPSNIPSGVNTQRAKASIQQWYGDYSLPADVKAVTKGTDLSRYQKLHDKSPIFLTDGYIVVNFNIESIRDKDFDNPYLQYIHAPFNNQWRKEGYSSTQLDPRGHVFNLLDGDVVFYHGDLSSLDDFKSNLTH